MTREHTTEITLPATPAEVWRALTDASYVQAWYVPEARIDARIGGEYFVSWGAGMEATATIEVLEPGRHLRVVSERKTAGNAEPVCIAIDYFLEAQGGETRLRLVHSGFLTSSEWDNEYNGTKMGWPVMLRILRYGLAHHPGVPGRQRWLYSTAPLSPVEAWRRFADVFRGAPAEYASEPSEYCAPWSEPGGGLVYAAFAERKGMTGISLHVVLYGEAAARIGEAAADWTARLETLYAASGKL